VRGMKRKEIAYLLVFSIVLINALTLVAFGSSEALMGNMSTSEYDKGFDPGSMNLSVKPGDDFYEYANGAWIKSHPVPADKSSYGEFDIVSDRTADCVKTIVENAANNTSAPEGSLEQKIGEFYRVGTDNVTRDKQRLDPIRDKLKLINNISNASDVQTVSTQMMDYGINPLFSMRAVPDKKNSKVTIISLVQGGLSLPDRDFYFRQDNASKMAREAYIAHIAKMFIYLGDNSEVAEDNAKTVMRIETRLANASFNSVDESDVIKTYNKMSLEELQAFAPGINWSRLFNDLGRPDIAEVNVRTPPFFKELSTALQDESVADWKTFLRWKLILNTSPYLSSDLEEEHFSFYRATLNQTMEPRWKRVINVESNLMGEAIGRIYVDRCFDTNSKVKMQEIVSNLKNAYRERIQNLTWMEPETKKKALMKLEALDVQVGYPDEWLNYSELDVKNDSYVNNSFRAAKFQFHYGPIGLERISKPVDRKIWLMNPQETNAYAYQREIITVFPAGILQPPFFNKEADDAVNYGAIGYCIGHEMTHHFDSQGRKYDASGNLTDWWTQKDEDNFNNSTRILVNEYNKFEVIPGLYINGNLTLSENIADFGGLTIAYHAYKLSSKGESEITDGFTGDQRFFLSFAQLWRESDTEGYLWNLALTEPHSPSKFRVNGVVYNMPEFYKTFPDIKPEDKLYRPENERPVIW
jgi:putative endopeptidase